MTGKKNDLYVTVPAPFRCPISMDVMKSPVSLCTGVTYDRSSIQMWLESGHNTCPVTMQVLHSTDFIPNLTLRSLIRHFSESLRLQLPPDNSTASSSSSSQLITKQQVTYSMRNIETGNSENRLNNLSTITDFAKFSEKNREFLAINCDFAPAMVRILKNVNENEIQILESCIELLDLMIIEVGVDKLNGLVFRTNHDCLSSFLNVLRDGKPSSKIASARVLQSIAFDSQSQRSVTEKRGLLQVLYRLIETESDQNQTTKEAVLSCLIAISTSRTVKQELAKKGIAKTAGEILSSSVTTAPVIERTLKLLEAVSTCTEGRSAIGEDEKCVSGVVKRIMTKSSSAEATEHGVAVLWSVCYLSRNATALKEATRSNAVAKVLLVMQSGCSGVRYQMCKDLVKVLRVNSKSCLASYHTKTTHITPY